MCNCNNNISLCSRCSKGLTCQCPPDYTVLPLPVSCGCCPSGYSWSGPTPNYPDGVCTGPGGVQTSPIPCSPCEETISAQCVILPAVSCYGVAAGTTLYDFINTVMCSDAFVSTLLSRIALSSTLKSSLCSITSTCPPGGTGTPIITSLTPGP